MWTNKIKRLYREIKIVGLRDWWWFDVYLNRNEFSYKLDIVNYWPDNLIQLNRDRRRAHNIEIKLSNIK